MSLYDRKTGPMSTLPMDQLEVTVRVTCTWSLWTNRRKEFRSCDHSLPIRDQSPGQETTLDQLETSIQVTWSLWTNQRPRRRNVLGSAPHSEFRLRNKWIEWVKQCINSPFINRIRTDTRCIYYCHHHPWLRTNWLSIGLSRTPHDWILSKPNT